MDHVVVDVEIQNTVEDTPGGWDATNLLGVSVACVYEYNTRRVRVYGPDDIEALQARLLRADRISGYNIWNFDFPVMWRISKSDWLSAGKGSDSSQTTQNTDKNTLTPTQISELKSSLYNKTDDLLRVIWMVQSLDPDVFFPATHGGWGLDKVAINTLGVGKIGHGAEAPKWYKQGLLHKVVNYCIDDVCLERDLVDFVDKYRYLIGTKILFVPKWDIRKGWTFKLSQYK